MKTKSSRACPVCGTPFTGELCPVCVLRAALEPESDSRSGVSSELRFEHYTVLKNADGTLVELRRGAMGVTYKAFDVHLQCPVALKIINARFIGDNSARLRFVRKARAAASVRHPNVASVFHLGKNGDRCFHAMECKRANDQYVAPMFYRLLQKGSKVRKRVCRADPVTAHSGSDEIRGLDGQCAF
ncbi:MAG TPA: hypothetical protein VFO40_09615 [Chthoniobacterales bacterium]|nr:hypothetical protein [Chthoniobacterales bacterium]